ncbi:hypothetical protein [Hufsiella ginkgonis]|uniref:Uncharacterized protein n=1 Tax=Hufsiella ginkgonis TaxID=2695274 RepID=A0A7K1XT51_9SPHI|nr:hypothetical protein [Hufsiella ginkgonis]MXV14132.1 hypothetical protein [Hufsiella ginkgonis]
MERSFTTIDELRTEIFMLKGRRIEQEGAIKEKFSSPGAIFGTITGLFKSGTGKQSLLGDLMSHDMVTTITRVVLPLVLNKIVFRKSGFITKAIVTFLSQKAAKNVNSDMFAGLVDKVTHLFKKRPREPKKSAIRIKDYGIPPDSETY